MTSVAQPFQPAQRAETRAQRMLRPALGLGGLAAATLALHFRDPHAHASWGLCPLYATTGIYCPGCGGLRAVNDLSNGDILGAASSNLLFFVSIPLIVFLLGRWVHDSWYGVERGRTWLSSWAFMYGALGVAAVFTVLRNTPAGSWLAP
ncbi:MAG TPA: DUF2752 domain-containing protein [Nocardioides sp.]|jgi:hypothetical protein